MPDQCHPHSNTAKTSRQYSNPDTEARPNRLPLSPSDSVEGHKTYRPTHICRDPKRCYLCLSEDPELIRIQKAKIDRIIRKFKQITLANREHSAHDEYWWTGGRP